MKAGAMDLPEAARRIQDFEGGSLRERLSALEQLFLGVNRQGSVGICAQEKIDTHLLRAAFELKKLAGQINVVIHAAGIIKTIPEILDEGEVIESLSLGAGNTGRDFDLETNHRVAEFKFINWRGGAESIRQNSLFKDFYTLAERETVKLRCLYVLRLEHPLKFFTGNRSLKSIMSRNTTLASDFQRRYGDRFAVVCEYYHYRRSLVQLIDMTSIVPGLTNLGLG